MPESSIKSLFNCSVKSLAEIALEYLTIIEAQQKEIQELKSQLEKLSLEKSKYKLDFNINKGLCCEIMLEENKSN
jgi:ABC-type phosphate transport system auxiliary subunit